MTFKHRIPETGRKSVTERARAPQTDASHMEMPLKTEDLKLLLPDMEMGTKPWVVLIPHGKQEQSMYALSKRSFSVQETDDQFIVHPKFI